MEDKICFEQQEEALQRGIDSNEKSLQELKNDLNDLRDLLLHWLTKEHNIPNRTTMIEKLMKQKSACFLKGIENSVVLDEEEETNVPNIQEHLHEIVQDFNEIPKGNARVAKEKSVVVEDAVETVEDGLEEDAAKEVEEIIAVTTDEISLPLVLRNTEQKLISQTSEDRASRPLLHGEITKCETRGDVHRNGDYHRDLLVGIFARNTKGSSAGLWIFDPGIHTRQFFTSQIPPLFQMGTPSTNHLPRSLSSLYQEAIRSSRLLLLLLRVLQLIPNKEKRFEIFNDNLWFIDEHDTEENRAYKLRLNRVADMTNEEYQTTSLGAKFNSKRRLSRPSSDPYEPCVGDRVPKFVDWRKEGVVVDVTDQESCASCWAFCTIVAATFSAEELGCTTYAKREADQEPPPTAANKGLTSNHLLVEYAASQGMHGCTDFALHMFDKMCRHIFCVGGGTRKGPMKIGVLREMSKWKEECVDEKLVGKQSLEIWVEYGGDSEDQTSQVTEANLINPGNNPFALLKGSIKVLEKHMGTFSKIENDKLPPPLEWLGWNSGDAFLSVHPYAMPLALLVATLLLICLGESWFFYVTTLIVGYIFILPLVLFYLGIDELNRYTKGEPLTLGRLYGITSIAKTFPSLFKQSLATIRHLMTMIKVVPFLSLNLEFFPLMCRRWIDIGFIRMFGESPTQGVKFFSASPLASSLVHGVVGIVYMLQLSIFVCLLRGVLHNRVLCCLGEPADLNYNSLYALTDDPVQKHACKVLLSANFPLDIKTMVILLGSEMISLTPSFTTIVAVCTKASMLAGISMGENNIHVFDPGG